ncbi:MAG: SgcJ/EcaC family oxidoreductase [Thermoanaerobaculaceae bacterium]|nr:SgcJ/EcaC family oxidoreductase [Thermoanaerobaculaceae bacterium]
MKKALVVMISLALAVPVLAAGRAAEETAIQLVWQQFSDAWARGDARGRAALWAEDASLINPFGVQAHGRAAIEKVFEQESAGFAKGTTQTFSHFSYRFLTPRIAEVDATGEIEGIRGADGAPLPSLTLHVFAIVTKAGGKWQIKDARPYVIAPIPGTPQTGTK